MDPNEDDLHILNAASQMEPNVVRDAGSTPYVLVPSIPSAVLLAIDALPSSFPFVEIGGYPCFAWRDWLQCKEQLIFTLMTRMTLRSLRLGLRGPEPVDLNQAPFLSPWHPIRDPDFGGAILIGIQTGHPTLEGNLINTSRICGMCLEGKWARTATRWYQLGERARPADLKRLSQKNASCLSTLGLTLQEVQQDIATDRVSAGLSHV
ncbi:DUF6634 family protein [Sulfitobacter dubius]|uniref:Uncharacterized protein n=1 Tax=Sulfitobacter dubius TaxID=218673 RepID=A0ABY3ZRZ4_9RHOB|nr:hypothetical protein DSM109990_03786 [Sulfitobacter dubius]